MYLHFHIHFHTSWGQELLVCGNLPELGAWNPEKALPLHYFDGGHWQVPLDLDENFAGTVSYKYILKHASGTFEWEAGDDRTLDLNKRFTVGEVHDQWSSKYDEHQALMTSAFKKVLMRRSGRSPLTTPKSGSIHRLQLRTTRVSPEYVVAVLGGHPALGNWDESKAVIMADQDFPLWQIDLPLKGASQVIPYKYAIYDPKEKKVVTFEEGPDRLLTYTATRKKKQLTVHTDEVFRYPVGNWKGAGVAIPVFSLRTEKSMGVGEFADIKPMVDWAKCTGQKLVQILPINDTLATHTWIDSYPYSAISVFALNPIYVNPDLIAELQDASTLLDLRQEAKRLNSLEVVDFEGVVALKMRWLKRLYAQEKEHFEGDKAFKAFLDTHKDWLTPYAVFCTLRDQYKTVDFRNWGEHSVYNADQIADMAKPNSATYDQVGFHLFVQWHLHQQLMDAAEYAREQGVVLKGDIPIGIYRHSVDAWVAPHLYNMDGQAGAPPDDFAVAGQNWRFPTYNWEEMAKDGYGWWKQRMQHMAIYFDAYRIDHILGFFRIWQIPGHHIQGILGQFNPSLPLNTYELSAKGLWHDKERLTQPYIRWHLLTSRFEEHAESVKKEFLDEPYPNHFAFKPQFKSQRGIEAYIDEKVQSFPDSRDYFERVRKGLYSLLTEVIFLPNTQTDEEAYDPRVAMHFTQSYQELDPGMRARLDEVYNDYFYHRHDSFWREQGLVKLPAIKDATDMLVCGEDLGMVPDCVPGVMRELGLLSLEIQRMPKDSKVEFGHPGDAPYLSVVSTSTHDMSTIRGWWEADQAVSQKFFNHTLGQGGAAPYYCEPWIVRDILNQHFFSPSMWAIIPLQDLLGMDADLRRKDPAEEQINVPANPEHYWRYRMHLSLEELLEAEDYNNRLKGMITASGRNEGH